MTFREKLEQEMQAKGIEDIRNFIRMELGLKPQDKLSVILGDDPGFYKLIEFTIKF